MTYPTHLYTLKKDHQKIKEQIKEWEITMDWIVDCLLNIRTEVGDIVVNEDGEGHKLVVSNVIDEAENLSHEMMTINT